MHENIFILRNHPQCQKADSDCQYHSGEGQQIITAVLVSNTTLSYANFERVKMSSSSESSENIIKNAIVPEHSSGQVWELAGIELTATIKEKSPEEVRTRLGALMGKVNVPNDYSDPNSRKSSEVWLKCSITRTLDKNRKGNSKGGFVESKNAFRRLPAKTAICSSTRLFNPTKRKRE